MHDHSLPHYSEYFSHQSQIALHAQLAKASKKLAEYANYYPQSRLYPREAANKDETRCLVLLGFLAWVSWFDENPAGCLARGLAGLQGSELTQPAIEDLLTSSLKAYTPHKNQEEHYEGFITAIEVSILLPSFTEDANLALFTRNDAESHPFITFYSARLKKASFLHHIILHIFAKSTSKRLDKLVLFVFLYHTRARDSNQQSEVLGEVFAALVSKGLVDMDVGAFQRLLVEESLKSLQVQLLEVFADYLLQSLGGYRRTGTPQPPDWNPRTRALLYDHASRLPPGTYPHIHFNDMSDRL